MEKQKEQHLELVQLPINKMHYSMLTQLLRNPLIFKLKYILNVYEGKAGMQQMVGRAAHEALKAYYGGNPDYPLVGDIDQRRGIAMQIGLDYLTEFNDFYIEYGKTGSREKMLKTYTQAIQFYFAEEPQYNEILLCEEKLEANIKTVDGDLLPLPAVGVPDLVHRRKDGGIEIIDFKFVKSFTDWEKEDHIKIVQAMFLYHLLRDAKGLNADRLLFKEVKVTENSGPNEGKPQIQDYAIPFNHEQYRIIFYNIFTDVVRFLSNPNAIYLPNFSDPFDGEASGLLYAQGLSSADMSDVEVMHKVKDVAFVSKKFVPSRLERIENENLPPEEKIKIRLGEFGIPVEPIEARVGASITQYRFKVSAGVRMSSFERHRADIARAIEAKGEVRILAPIPGTGLVGVEVASKTRASVKLDTKKLDIGTMMLPIGIDVNGNIIKADLRDFPHLLVAGAAGSGKSVLLHVLLTALSKQMSIEEMELVLIDPKRVELVAFSKDKHLRSKIIYEYEDAVKQLMELVDEMDERYAMLEKARKRDLGEYNRSKKKADEKLPYIVVVIDEFADFIFRSKLEEKRRKSPSYASRSKEFLIRDIASRTGYKASTWGYNNPTATKQELVEALEAMDDKDPMKREDANIELLVVRLAQMARAAGIHIILATQRPSVDVITGLIKANFPSRIALTTASPTDSIVILGQPGAEKLSGKGDLIFMNAGGSHRLQGFAI